jgi:hypothetical protein
MKPWLRLTLITATVGGGWTGVAITLQSLLGRRDQAAVYYVLMVAFLAVFAFITISGLVFVLHPERTTPLVLALALQIPLVSSPIVAYRLAAGFQVSVGFLDGRFSGGFRLGTDFQINFFQRLPWGVGINLFALVFLVLLVRATRMPNPPPQTAVTQTAVTLGISAASDNTASPTSATPPGPPG